MGSHLLCFRFAHQAGWLDQEHDDEDTEHDGVGERRGDDTNNVGDNYESDEALYNALKDTIVPNYEKMVKDVSAIDLGEYTEFNELKSLIIQYWSKKLEAFNKMIDALEAQDSDRVTKANDLLGEAEDIYKKYESELEKLEKEYDIVTED